MAALETHPPVQIVNVDLAVERQNILREKLEGYFSALSKRARVNKRVTYIVNAEGSTLESVLRMNQEAEALFTAFNYDQESSGNIPQSLTVATPGEMLSIDPQLRYPVIARMQKMLDHGEFRHRKLILVGDLYEKIAQYLRSALPVVATHYLNPERTEISPPVPITSQERLTPDPDAEPGANGVIPVGALVTLQVAGISFDGVVNMPEEGNRFVLKDQTLVDTARKLFLSDGMQARMVREQIAEEKLVFVRGKRVFILLEPDLEHIISQRFTFDRMDNLYAHHTLEEALKTLEGGRSEGIVEYFEREGYGLVFDALDQDERDKLLVAVLQDKLTPLLLKEVETVKPLIGNLEASDLESLFYNLPEPVVEQTLDTLKEKNYERFLSYIPPKMREGVILEFLRDPKRIQAAWKGIGQEEKKEIMASQASWIHGMIFLLSSDLSKRKFPALQFDFQRSYHSNMLGKMNRDEQMSTLATIVHSIEAAGAPSGLLARQLEPPELERFMVEYILRHPAEFYNRLNPGIRKQIWITVGREFKDQISKNLHALDKIEILKGNQEASVGIVFNNPEFQKYLKSGEDPEFSGSLFLALKKLNKAESKTALLKRVLSDPDWRSRRIKGVPALLTDPDNGLIFEKLSEQVEELDFKFDSLVCTKADYETLKDKEALAGAVVTLVDDLVDPSLYNLFQTGKLDKEQYDQFSNTVEKEIEALRRKMAASEVDDPVGIYVLETMQTLNALSNQTLSGGLNEDALAQLDERVNVRRRLVDAMKEHLRRIDDFLGKAGKKLPLMNQKIAQLQQAAQKENQRYDNTYRMASGLIEEFRKLQQLQQKGLEDKKIVALTQKKLSVQFFQLIQPLILDKVRALGNPLKKMMRMVGIGKKSTDQDLSQRVIFKFTDEEIAQILRYKIVFCSKDSILAQFVATCLRIDKLEDTLFTLATAETLPEKSDIDILFYGPGYTVDDFSESVHERRMVSFADQEFYNRLLKNEKLKSRTKAILSKAGQGLKTHKPLLEKANLNLKALQARRRQVETAAGNLEEERRKLRSNLEQHRERRHHYEGELELLESRLEEIDGKFDDLHSRIGQLIGGESGEVITAIQSEQSDLGEQLRDELLALNKELSRMMFIKGVKEAGETITHTTQEEILQQIESREIYRYKQRPFKKLIVSDDGTNVSVNLKRVFIDAAVRHFKLPEMAVQEVSINRMLTMAENGDGQAYPFLVVISDKPQDNYQELKLKIKKIRNHLPDTYQMVITPFGDLTQTQQDSPLFRNLQAIKEHCALVNADIGNFSEPASVLKLLKEKAPLG